MFDFGLDGYRPAFCHGLDEVRERHGPVLSAMLGRRLESPWLAWPVPEPEPAADPRRNGRWSAFYPILLDFGGGDQIEVHQDPAWGVSVTRNSVTRSAAIRGVGEDLEWRDDRPEVAASLRGQYLWAVDLLERPSFSACGDVAIGLAFSAVYLTIFEGFDGTRLALGPPDPHYQQFRLASMPSMRSRHPKAL